MAKKQFKSESKRLLDLMVNSIYTHKEIFLREIISNASDAVDKLCYISLTDDSVGMAREDFKISVTADKEARTITVSDNGVGMTEEEMEQNLGVIAKSGSLQFKKDMQGDKPEDVDIIGQFGVGFYSAFMVAAKVKVVSKAYGADTAFMWESEGSDGYTIVPCDRENVGTDVIMELKPDSEEENYSEFLEEFRLHEIIKKYSDYIRWPIEMEVTKSRQVDSDEVGEDGKKKRVWEDYKETEVVNSRIPIWQRPKSEVSEEDCIKFYKEKYYDMEDPAGIIRVSAEGTVSYKAMLFIPSVAPFDFYSRDYKAGLQLYSSGVMIMDRCDELVPEHFRFVRGIVDTQDLSLNISREMLQHDRQLKVIASNLEKKIRTELARLLEKEPDKYEKFYKSFGMQLKYGILNSYGATRETLEDLILFYSANAEKLVPIARYVENMPESQQYIYYACADSVEAAAKLPQTEIIRDKGYDILYLTQDADEFVVKMLGQYKEKQFRSVTSDDLGLETDEEKQETERQETENKELLEFVKESLGGKLAAAKLSHRLKSRPVCLTTQGNITLEMERYFASLPNEAGQNMRAQRVLELNASAPTFAALKNAYAADKDKAAKYAELLYDQALLMAGLNVEDPARMSELICELMV